MHPVQLIAETAVDAVKNDGDARCTGMGVRVVPRSRLSRHAARFTSGGRNCRCICSVAYRRSG